MENETIIQEKLKHIEYCKEKIKTVLDCAKGYVYIVSGTPKGETVDSAKIMQDFIQLGITVSTSSEQATHEKVGNEIIELDFSIDVEAINVYANEIRKTQKEISELIKSQINEQ